ncbi:uncharacterized protein LOC134813590 [Bolinopsis microptera]|uniref:uncharacterized protein LOC134813590 n=1 Tax=Bolinopsis microptera TaxID=2820187 RepID=UPI003078C4E0
MIRPSRTAKSEKRCLSPDPLATVDTGNSSSEPEKKRTRVKKTPINKCPVCSLAAAEVEANYTMRVAATTDATASQPQSLTTLTKGKRVRDADRTTRYSVQKNLKIKRAEQDIVIGRPGVIPEAQNLNDPVSAFDYFVTVDIQKKVISFTNKRIAATLKRQASSENTDGSDNEGEEEIGGEEDDRGIGTWIDADPEDREPEEEEDLEEVERIHADLEIEEDYVLTEDDRVAEAGCQKLKKFITLEEFRAFLGLWLMRGLYSQANTKLSNLYQSDHLPVFSAVLPINRFKWILRHLSFDGCVNSEERSSVAFFSHIMDTTRVNVQNLVTLNNGGNPRLADSFAFGKKLAMGLINPYLEKKGTAGLTPVNLVKMYLVTKDNRYLMAATKESSAPSHSDDILPFKGQSSQTPARCGSCIVDLRDINEAAGRYRGKNSLTKSSGLCEKCGVVKCTKKHLVKLCISCFKSL